jgi:hypothetical protein
MSGVVKGVGKVFKKVGKFVLKVAPYALAAAAVVFTAGAAIPAVGAALGGATLSGTLGAGVASVLGEGALSSIVTGALTKAAYGAAIGGITSKLTGGKFSDGLKMGAIGGAIVGGVGEAVSQAGLFGSSAATGATPGVSEAIQPESAYAPGAVQAQSLAPQGLLNSGGMSTPAPGFGLGNTASSATSAADSASGLLSKGGWLERNGDLAGNVIAGLGKGLLGSSEAEAAAQAEREKANIARENYAGAGGLLAYQPNLSGLTSFGRQRNFGGYVRDPGTGRYLWQS